MLIDNGCIDFFLCSKGQLCKKNKQKKPTTEMFFYSAHVKNVHSKTLKNGWLFNTQE